MITKYIIHGIISGLLFLLINVLYIDTVLANMTGEARTYSISNVEVLEDPEGSYDFQQVSAADYGSQYRPYHAEVLSLGITKSVYWVRFKLLSGGGMENKDEKYLQLSNSNLDKIDIYLPQNKGEFSEDSGYRIKQVGVSRPKENRDVMDNTWVFKLSSPVDEQKFIYLRLESTSALRLPIVCWSADSFIKESFLKNLGFGAFYGVLLVMLIFNFVIYLVLRDKVYLYYVLYIGFMFLYQFQVHGHFKMLVDLPYKIYNAVFWLWLAAAFISSAYFTRYFLKIDTALPHFDKLLTGMVLLSIVQGVVGICGYNIWANQLAHGLGILGPVVIMIAAVIRFRQGFRPARYYIVAWGVLSNGIVAWTLSAYIPSIVSGVNYLLLATASEAVLLSLALAERVKNLKLRGEVLRESVQQYKQLSLTDEMTGLYNKRCFNEKINEEINKAIHEGKPMSMLVIDIDYFKIYNDTYGHWEGDKVLSHIGEILLTFVEEGQLPFRYGGEEFVLLLPDINRDDAYWIAEKIRKTIMKQRFVPTAKSGGAVTISAGLTELQPSDNYETVFQRADLALYKAKENGRNQIVIL